MFEHTLKRSKWVTCHPGWPLQGQLRWRITHGPAENKSAPGKGNSGAIQRTPGVFWPDCSSFGLVSISPLSIAGLSLFLCSPFRACPGGSNDHSPFRACPGGSNDLELPALPSHLLSARACPGGSHDLELLALHRTCSSSALVSVSPLSIPGLSRWK